LKFALAQQEDQSMKRSRFSEEQIIGILKEREAGVSVADLCRKHGVSDASICDLAPKFYPFVSSLLAFGLPCRAV
jgi:putative transposase